MANPRFNKQVTNRRGAMGGGMMKNGACTRKEKVAFLICLVKW